MQGPCGIGTPEFVSAVAAQHDMSTHEIPMEEQSFGADSKVRELKLPSCPQQLLSTLRALLLFTVPELLSQAAISQLMDWCKSHQAHAVLVGSGQLPFHSLLAPLVGPRG